MSYSFFATMCVKLLLSSPHRLDPPVLLADPLRRLPAVLDLRRVAHRPQGDLPRLPLHHRVAWGEVRRERRLDCTKEWKRFLKFMVSRKKRGDLFMRRTVIRGGREKKFLLPFCEREREREGEEIFLGKGGECADKLSFFSLSLPRVGWVWILVSVSSSPHPLHTPRKKTSSAAGFFLRGGRKRRKV